MTGRITGPGNTDFCRCSLIYLVHQGETQLPLDCQVQPPKEIKILAAEMYFLPKEEESLPIYMTHEGGKWLYQRNLCRPKSLN